MLIHLRSSTLHLTLHNIISFIWFYTFFMTKWQVYTFWHFNKLATFVSEFKAWYHSTSHKTSFMEPMKCLHMSSHMDDTQDFISLWFIWFLAFGNNWLIGTLCFKDVGLGWWWCEARGSVWLTCVTSWHLLFFCNNDSECDMALEIELHKS